MKNKRVRLGMKELESSLKDKEIREGLTNKLLYITQELFEMHHIYEVPYCWVMIIYRRIKRVLSWLPFLWYDNDWDGDTCLLDVMQYKIQRMRRNMLEDDVFPSKDRNKYADDMGYCIEIINRIRDDDYCNKEYEEVFKKHPMIWIPISDTSYSMTYQNDEQAKKEFNEADKKAQTLRHNDYQRLGRILENESKKWYT